jgi:predicted DNA-binding protein
MKRTTFAYSDKIDQALNELSTKEGVTKADILRRAIALYKRLYELSVENDGKILATNSTGEKAVEIYFE